MHARLAPFALLLIGLFARPASAQLQLIVDRELDLMAFTGVDAGVPDMSPSVADVSWRGDNPGGFAAPLLFDVSDALSAGLGTVDARLSFSSDFVALRLFPSFSVSPLLVASTAQAVSYAGETQGMRMAIEGSVGATLLLQTGSGYQPVTITGGGGASGFPDSYELEIRVTLRSINNPNSDTHELIIEPILFELHPSPIPGVNTLRRLPSDATVRLTTPTGSQTFDNIGAPEEIVTSTYTDFFSAYTGVWTVEIEEPGQAPDVYEIGTGFDWDTTDPYRFVNPQPEGGVLLYPIDVSRTLPDATLPGDSEITANISLSGMSVAQGFLDGNDTVWAPDLSGLAPDEYLMTYFTGESGVAPPFTVSGVSNVSPGNRPLTAATVPGVAVAIFGRNVLINFPTLCEADFDNDYDVDLSDFGIFGSAFGSSVGDANYNPAADFDGDGDVDLSDFGAFGSQFGNGPAECAP